MALSLSHPTDNTSSLAILTGALDGVSEPWHSSSIPDTRSPRKANAPISSPRSSLNDDGDNDKSTNRQMLFWVPPEHHLGLFQYGTLQNIGAQPTRLNMLCFVHGPQWMQCRTQDC